MRTIAYIFVSSLSFLFCVAFASCTDDDLHSIDAKRDTGGELEIRFTVHTPSNAMPATYAMTAVQENHIGEIDILAFRPGSTPSGQQFAYRATVAGVITESGQSRSIKEFTVTLRCDNAPQTFVILANCRDRIDALGNLTAGSDKDQLLEELVLTKTGKWGADSEGNGIFDAIPMWGETVSLITESTASITGVKLLRMVARADVLVQPSARGTFTLKEIYLYNASVAGRIVPDPANLETLSRVDNATEPLINPRQSPLFYSVVNSQKNNFSNEIYLFESAATPGRPLDVACVVIGGLFSGDASTTYYRLDFLSKNPDGTYSTNYKDILRNHCYRLLITSVAGSGYDTPDEAFRAKSLNITAEIIEWDEGDFDNVVFDGQYLLSVSEGIFETDRAESLITTNVITDYPGGWSAVVDPSASGWLTMEGAASGVSGVEGALTVRVSANGGAPRTGTVFVTAGRLKYAITVNQSDLDDLRMSIIPGGDGSVIELPSGYGHSLPITPLSLNVSWAPRGYSCIVTRLQDHIGFLYPIPYALPAGGTYTINATPAAMTSADVTAPDVFPVKSTSLEITVYNLTGHSATAGVTLRQVHYDVVPLPAASYLIDGSTYSFTVHSNTPWTASVSRDDSSIIESITASGGNASPENFSFKLADNRAIMTAEAYIKFSSVEGKFSDFEIKIFGYGGYTVSGGTWPGTNLGYNLLLAPDDLNGGNPGSWYSFANVPYATNSVSVPPLGPQSSPLDPASCAAIDPSLSGDKQWRLPTLYELNVIRSWCVNNGGFSRYKLRIGNNPMDYYWSATTYESTGEVNARARIIKMYDGSQSRALKSNTTSSDGNNNVILHGRCIRRL